jgi:hypothetical protein
VNAPPCEVFCGRPNGLTIYHGAEIVSLSYGVNEGVDRIVMGAWLAANRHLAIVRNGTVRIVERVAADIAS